MLYPWFANPWALGLLAALPVLAVFATVAWLRRRQALALLGTSSALHLVAVQGRTRRFLRAAGMTAGLILLIVGIAGPQWGHEPGRDSDRAGGRDLVVVLDLSRSMLAEQPSRQERALRALKDLAANLEERGGHRVALVVFASHARVVFPLTTDYDHFRAALTQQDADNLPPALRPQKGETVRSGTRIGEALRVAVAAHEARFQGARDILLLSDGDDPGGDDEWAEGAAAARAQGIPVYAFGMGDPATASPIPSRNGFLMHNRQIVKTRLEERPLQEIARRTGGLYFPAHTNILPLGKLFRQVIEPRGAQRAGNIGEESLPRYRQHYAWFFAASLAFLSLSLVPGGWRWRGTNPMASRVP